MEHNNCGCRCGLGLDSGGLLLQRGDYHIGAIQVMLGKHLGVSLIGVFNDIGITENNKCMGATIATAAIP